LKVSVVLWVMAGESPSGGLRRLGFHTCPILSSENGQVPKVRTLLPFLFRAAQKRVTALRAGLHHRLDVPVPTLALVSCGPHQGWGLSAGSLPLPTVSCLHSKGHPAVTAGPPRSSRELPVLSYVTSRAAPSWLGAVGLGEEEASRSLEDGVPDFVLANRIDLISVVH
jgi:hypothetical protein